MARSEGFEPPTPRFEVWCSIQLSYERLARPVVAGCPGIYATGAIAPWRHGGMAEGGRVCGVGAEEIPVNAY
jgi:hypothetical protein